MLHCMHHVCHLARKASIEMKVRRKLSLASACMHHVCRQEGQAFEGVRRSGCCICNNMHRNVHSKATWDMRERPPSPGHANATAVAKLTAAQSPHFGGWVTCNQAWELHVGMMCKNAGSRECFVQSCVKVETSQVQCQGIHPFTCPHVMLLPDTYVQHARQQQSWISTKLPIDSAN